MALNFTLLPPSIFPLGLSYLLVYRTDDYQTSKRELDRAAQKVLKIRQEGLVGGKARRNMDQIEESIKHLQKDLMLVSGADSRGHVRRTDS